MPHIWNISPRGFVSAQACFKPRLVSNVLRRASELQRRNAASCRTGHRIPRLQPVGSAKSLHPLQHRRWRDGPREREVCTTDGMLNPAMERRPRVVPGPRVMKTWRELETEGCEEDFCPGSVARGSSWAVDRPHFSPGPNSSYASNERGQTRTFSIKIRGVDSAILEIQAQNPATGFQYWYPGQCIRRRLGARNLGAYQGGVHAAVTQDPGSKKREQKSHLARCNTTSHSVSRQLGYRSKDGLTYGVYLNAGLENHISKSRYRSNLAS